jgi:hypothetical protein
MLYALVIVVLLGGPQPAKNKPPVLHRVTFSIPYTDLNSCQAAQRLMAGYEEEVGMMAARLWLPRRLMPIAGQTSCVVQPTLGL